MLGLWRHMGHPMFLNPFDRRAVHARARSLMGCHCPGNGEAELSKKHKESGTRKLRRKEAAVTSRVLQRE